MNRGSLVASIDEEIAARLADVVVTLPEAGPLLLEISRLIDAGGKRLRPLFCYWGYRVGAPHGAAIVAASCALELLHTFALIHDDIMDESRLRRGSPTVNDAKGNDFALLAGDLALVLADEVFLSAGWDDAVAIRGFAPYSRMRQEVIAGQYMDLAAGEGGSLTRADARRIAVLKSGRYSIEMPLVIGATLAGLDDDTIGSLKAAGAPLGEAFKLRDDLLGTFGEQGVTGKPADSDIRAGKRNFLFASAMDLLDGDDRDRLLEGWGRGDDLDETSVEDLRGLIEGSGARLEAEDLLEELRGKGLEALGRIDMEPEVAGELVALAHEAVDRAS